MGPNQSANRITCGSLPLGVNVLPKVGQCVSLFPHLSAGGKKITWTSTSLQARIADTGCPQH